ncbi:MAG: hypothetical protein WC718_05475 [Phycisphaerales bacterium]|jgi:hypothetical protein
MKKTSILAAVAGLAIATGAASAQVYSASPGLQIISTATPSGTVNSTINVAGGPSNVTDLNVIFQANHTWDSDVDVVLQGPTGYICLSTDNGGSGDNYLTTRFDDISTVSITSGVAPFNGNYRPEGTLNGWAGSPLTFVGTNYTTMAGFNGTNANGAWTMYVADDTGGDSGIWSYWSLEFNGSVDPVGPPPLGAPTNPTGAGSYSVASIPSGGMTNFRVTVTPGTFPNSTGLGVTVNGAAVGLGTVLLVDDGTNDDGIAGNNIFGLNNVVITAAPGDYVLPFTVTDGQARSSTGNMPNLNIQGPPPACPAGTQPASFAGVASFDALNSANNAHLNLGWTGTDAIQDIHVSGRLTRVTAGTFASEARILITFSDASTITLQPFTTTGFTGFLDVTDYVFTLPTPKPVSSITDVQLYESFDDATGAVDSTWTALCLTWNPLLVPIAPSVTGSSTPAAGFAGAPIHLTANVTPGFNPASTGLAVSVDASAIGAGTVALLDDGINDDGILGNNIFGANTTVAAGTPDGLYTLSVTVTDAQSRSGSNTFDVTVNPRGQWEESIDGGGDAGELPTTAQVIAGPDGPVDSIGGNIVNGETDMFAINICDPSSFSADPAISTRTDFDTQLFLFDSNGVGVEFNDDTTGLISRLDNSFVTAPGLYYIAISGYNRDPLDADGSLLWNNTPFNTVRAPDGPGATNPVSSWTGTGGSGSYIITLTGVCIQNTVPCDPDVNQDGNADQGDVDYLVNVVAGGPNDTGIDPDFNRDGNVDQGDIDALINVVAGGACP